MLARGCRTLGMCFFKEVLETWTFLLPLSASRPPLGEHPSSPTLTVDICVIMGLETIEPLSYNRLKVEIMTHFFSF